MLRMADRDVTAFEVLCRSEDVHHSIICFHAQQAIEKCLKAVLFCHLIEFRRTHDLDLLSDLLKQHQIALPLSPSQLTTLSPCAVLLRYDDVEIEIATITRSDLAQMIASTRAWAGDICQTAIEADADAE